MNEPNTLQQALRHFKAGDFLRAEEVCKSVLEAQPDEPDALHLLGAVALQRGKNRQAIQLIGQAIQQNPRNSIFYVHLAECYSGLGRPDHAVSFSEQALQIDPACAEAYCAIGSAFLAQGLRSEAVSSFDRALELKPGFAEAHYNKGNALSEMGMTDEAIAAYREAIALVPSLSAAHFNLGNALALRGDNLEAAEAYQEAIRLAPGFAPAHFNLGNTRRKLGLIGAAREAFRRVLELDPSIAAAHRYLGNLAKLQGRVPEALACFERALELDPSDAEAQSELAHVQLLLGDTSGAIAGYRRAVKIDPGFAWAYMGLSSALAKAADIDAAREATRKAIQLRRRFEWPFRGHQPIGRIVSLKGIEDGCFEIGTGDEFGIEGGLNNADTHFDKTKFWQCSFYVDDLEPDEALGSLPDCDLVFNIISDPDSMPRSLDSAKAIADRLTVPVVNHPAAVAQTQRHRNYAALHDLDGIVFPKTFHLTSPLRRPEEVTALLEKGGVDFPLLLRCAGTHWGITLAKVETVEQALEYFATHPAKAFYVTEFFDLANENGIYSKYRVRVVDDQLYPEHAFIGGSWKIQTFEHVRKYMLTNSWSMERAKRFFDNPEGQLGKDAWQALAAIRSRVPLDYFGIDFTQLPDGKILVFEANATMRLAHPELGDLQELHDIRLPSVEAIRQALQRHLEKRIRRH